MPPEMMQGQMPPPQQPMAVPPEGMQQWKAQILSDYSS
jgi:hypothetical protein